MLKMKHVLFLLLPSILAACALGDVADATTLPPITLAPPPALNLEGSCDDTKPLETWLQITSELRANFQTQMNAAAAKNKGGMYGDVITLAALRDSAFDVPTPDCAAEVGIKLSDIMSQAVVAFQMFVNGQTSELNSTITDLNGQLDEVTGLQDELVDRLNTQFQQQLQETTEP
jgi:hypothetical protein